MDGDNLAGTVSSERGTARIERGKISGDEIAFDLIRKSNNDEITIHFKGRIEGDTMKLTMQFGKRDPVAVHRKERFLSVILIHMLCLMLSVGLLGAQDFSHLQVEQIASGFAGGEGPVWSREGYLLFSDYEASRIYKYVHGKSPEVYREASDGANGNTMDRQGRLYSCEYKSRRVTRTNRQGKIEVLADKFEGKRFNAPNDIVVRRDGHVSFSDPLYRPLDHRELDFFGVYHKYSRL